MGISLFGNTTIGFVLFLTHILSCLTVGILFRFWKCKKKNIISKNHANLGSKKDQKTTANFSNLGSILQNSIMSSINTIIMIGGFVMLFSVIISILNNTKIFEILSIVSSPILNKLNLPISFANGFFAGIIELTNGVSLISKVPFKAISVNMIICSFLLGFGGISILLQVLSITSTSDISIKPYIMAKLMQGSFAAIYTYLILSNFAFLNFDI
ncbi:MAG: hypothetical protein HFJ50_07640 [Clostridia bacterium]|nr:hypothetical protein [Clostridia bacterium]